MRQLRYSIECKPLWTEELYTSPHSIKQQSYYEETIFSANYTLDASRLLRFICVIIQS